MSSHISTVTAVAAGCVGIAVASCSQPSEPRAVSSLNVLLITIDTLRADAVGAYRHTGATPVIDRLASAGVRFDVARAHTVVTLPSHANILSGRLPPDHGVRDNAGFRFPDSVETAATILKARGYHTGAFVSGFPLESRFGLARGFDAYDDQFADAGPRPAFLVQERPGPETVRLARQWLDSVKDRWFCWVHLYEPHFPYEPAGSFAQRFQNNPYLGEVAAADAALAPLLKPILEGADRDRTLVILTGDHGEALGDHGEATHGVFAYEAVLRVPLVVYAPSRFKPGVVTRPASHVDLLPTILDALSVPAPSGLRGRSLVPSMSGKPHDTVQPMYFEALSASLNRRWAPLYGMVQDDAKYIALPIPELYDLRNDPEESHNLAAARPQQVAQMQSLVTAARGSDSLPVRRAEDPQTRERLRSLGYVASASGARTGRYTDVDDPKRLIRYDTQLHQVTAAYLAGDVAGALAKCRQLVQERPDTPLWLLHLALLERENGNLAAGIAALRKVVALSPDDSEAVSLLGAYLGESGRAAEAVEILRPYADRPGAALEVLTTYGLALAKAGRTREALTALATARERDPSNGMTIVDVATVHLIAGDRELARQAFEDALAVNPQIARAHSSLGVIAIEEGRTQAAVEHWRAATTLDPREHANILRVGAALARAGRTAEARACLQFFVETAPPARYERDIERARVWLKQGS